MSSDIVRVGGLLLDGSWVDGFGLGWKGRTSSTSNAKDSDFLETSSSSGSSFFVLVRRVDDGLVAVFLVVAGLALFLVVAGLVLFLVVAGLALLLVRRVDDGFYWDGKGLVEMNELGIWKKTS